MSVAAEALLVNANHKGSVGWRLCRSVSRGAVMGVGSKSLEIDQDVDFVSLFYIVKMTFKANSGCRVGERQYRSKATRVCLGSEQDV